jgi:hypothetical protein
MKTACFYFAVLVPHRDFLPLLDAYRRSLFAAGLPGAFAFPAAAPLALLSRPLADQEVKDAVANMRSMLGKRKLQPGLPVTLAGSPAAESSAPGCSGCRLQFFGPSLELPPPSLPPDAVISIWEKPALAPVVLGPGDTEELTAKAQELAFRRGRAIPEISFRAAALANLTLWSAECGEPGFSFQWEIGPLFWLPNHRKGITG